MTDQTPQPTSDPIAVMLAIDADAARLDQLEKLLGDASDALDQAEENWDEVYDQIARELKDQMDTDGRKGDPAEHWITATARQRNRDVYKTWRRARRALDRIEKQVKAKTAAMSGRQSELGALRDEARAAASYQAQPRRVA
jgi:hypothetical protein